MELFILISCHLEITKELFNWNTSYRLARMRLCKSTQLEQRFCSRNTRFKLNLLSSKDSTLYYILQRVIVHCASREES